MESIRCETKTELKQTAYSGQYYKLKRTNTPAGSTIRITGFGENESKEEKEK